MSNTATTTSNMTYQDFRQNMHEYMELFPHVNLTSIHKTTTEVVNKRPFIIHKNKQIFTKCLECLTPEEKEWKQKRVDPMLGVISDIFSERDQSRGTYGIGNTTGSTVYQAFLRQPELFCQHKTIILEKMMIDDFQKMFHSMAGEFKMMLSLIIGLKIVRENIMEAGWHYDDSFDEVTDDNGLVAYNHAWKLTQHAFMDLFKANYHLFFKHRGGNVKKESEKKAKNKGYTLPRQHIPRSLYKEQRQGQFAPQALREQEEREPEDWDLEAEEEEQQQQQRE